MNILNFLLDEQDVVDYVWYRNDDGDVVYEFAVPGFKKEDITVDFLDGVITIKGKRDVKDRYVGVKEIFRRIYVPKAEDVEANLSDGVLKIVIKPQSKNYKRIEIK